MTYSFTLSQFHTLYPNDESCLEEIKKIRYPNGIKCVRCNKITTHYKLLQRTSYSCKNCRSQVYPLSGTIFEKSSTPLTKWFYAIYLMALTRSSLSVKQLERELGVTYKTAWRIYKSIYMLMAQNDGDLLLSVDDGQEEGTVRRWVFFNKIELTFVQKEKKPR